MRVSACECQAIKNAAGEQILQESDSLHAPLLVCTWFTEGSSYTNNQLFQLNNAPLKLSVHFLIYQVKYFDKTAVKLKLNLSSCTGYFRHSQVD